MPDIYNTLTRQKEPFIPLRGKKVGFYACGPTVYDLVHLGNARSFTAFDMVVRYLRFQGFAVRYVRNITDIDDKIIARAAESGKNFSEVADTFTKAFHEDMTALGLLSPDEEPRATDTLPEIIALIQKLIEAGRAYLADNGDVYFEVRTFPGYGTLSGRNVDELQSGSRVEISSVKRDPLDFVLWKMAKPGEPSWPSPWGAGRPGWHIECSAMSLSLLGDSLDIHAGGRDLIFPHHENEIAQSEGVTGKPFVRYWLHAGYLQMEKEKMSKSLGNFLTVRELLKSHLPEVLRFFLLSSHYRSSLSYSEEALRSARQGLSRLYAAWADSAPAAGAAPLRNDFFHRFVAAMEDDFNTPVAFSVLFDLAHVIQRMRESDPANAASHAALLRELGEVLGLFGTDPVLLLQGRVAESEAVRIEKLIADRNAARLAKDWLEADRIRDLLLAESIVLEDSATGTRWKKEEERGRKGP